MEILKLAIINEIKVLLWSLKYTYQLIVDSHSRVLLSPPLLPKMCQCFLLVLMTFELFSKMYHFRSKSVLYLQTCAVSFKSLHYLQTCAVRFKKSSKSITVDIRNVFADTILYVCVCVCFVLNLIVCHWAESNLIYWHHSCLERPRATHGLSSV